MTTVTTRHIHIARTCEGCGEVLVWDTVTRVAGETYHTGVAPEVLRDLRPDDALCVDGNLYIRDAAGLEIPIAPGGWYCSRACLARKIQEGAARMEEGITLCLNPSNSPS